MTDRATDDRLGRLVHRTLLAGVAASAALLIGGLAMSLERVAPPHEPVKRFGQLVERALAGDGTALIDVGFVVLMFTPVLRVLVLAIAWLRARDWRMAAVALVVLALLSASVLVGVG